LVTAEAGADRHRPASLVGQPARHHPPTSVSLSRFARGGSRTASGPPERHCRVPSPWSARSAWPQLRDAWVEAARTRRLMSGCGAMSCS